MSRKRARLLVLLCVNPPPHKIDLREANAMTEKMMSYCGLICTNCGAYIAKRTNDDELRSKTAKRWSSPEWTVKPEEINCDGCTSDSDELFKHCYECGVRACSRERSVETCAHCSDY
ncbi:MAG: DUF3795 domain-containing protein, partial [Candidatus Thorarchaeota archaeon]